MAAICIGDLDQRVAIQQPTVTRNDIGEQVMAWTTAGTFWADVKLVKVQDRPVGDSDRNVITHEVILRKNSTPGIDDRVVWKSYTLEIRNILPLEKYEEFMVLECSTCLM